MPLQYITSTGVLHLRDSNAPNKTILVDATVREKLSRKVAATGSHVLTGRGRPLRAIVLDRSDVSTMAPNGSSAVIDLCDSDGDIPAPRAPKRRPEANISKRPEVKTVPPSDEKLAQDTRRKVQDHGPSKLRVDLSKSNVRPSLGNPSTPLSAQAGKVAKVKESSRAANKASASEAGKPGVRTKDHSSKGTQNAVDSSDDETTSAVRALRKSITTSDMQRDKERSRANSLNLIKQVGVKRSRDDGGSMQNPPQKKQKFDIRNGAREVSSSSDKISRRTLPTRTERVKTAAGNARTGPVVDLTTSPVGKASNSGKSSTIHVSLLSDEDDQDDVEGDSGSRLALRGQDSSSKQHKLSAGVSSHVGGKQDRPPRVKTADSAAQKSLLRVPDRRKPEIGGPADSAKDLIAADGSRRSPQTPSGSGLPGPTSKQSDAPAPKSPVAKTPVRHSPQCRIPADLKQLTQELAVTPENLTRIERVADEILAEALADNTAAPSAAEDVAKIKQLAHGALAANMPLSSAEGLGRAASPQATRAPPPNTPSNEGVDGQGQVTAHGSAASPSPVKSQLRTATRQVDMPEASVKEVAVTRNPASVPINTQRDSASPLDNLAPHSPQKKSEGSVQMDVTEADDMNGDGVDARRILALQGHDKPKATLSALGLSKQVEMVLGKYLEEMRGDNEYWNKTWLNRARRSLDKTKPNARATETAGSFAAKTEAPYSFAAMKPLQLRPAGKDAAMEGVAHFTVEKIPPPGEKPKKTILSVPVTSIDVRDQMPNYSHAVSIKSNFLAPNVTNLQHWPYFGDNFDCADAESLREQYNLDIHKRPTKLLRLAQAQNLESYVEDALKELGLVWDDVLRFFLEAKPDVGSDPDALQALRARPQSCSEDFSTQHQRTAIVLSSLRHSSPERLAKAAVLCENFHKMSYISLWHVARKHQLRAVPDEEEIDETDLVNELTCRICLRFSCPYHGELQEDGASDVDDAASSESVDNSAVLTDIICPPKVNYRTRVAFPKVAVKLPVAAELTRAQKKDRRLVEYWLGKDQWNHDADQRGPFYPCDHPGSSCEDAKCSCFQDSIPCEKTCSCSSDCQRKFMGCACSSLKTKGRKLLCFDDDRCACHRFGRECDPDLCGACGVCEVVDPMNRYNDQVLVGRCRNASIQRGVPKRTLLGDSGIHGFGLYAGEEIDKHEFVGEYKGEVITKNEAERRGAVYEYQKLSYLFSLNRSQEIDSTYFGNKIRFINHAGDGYNTLFPRVILVNMVHRIALYAERNIRVGEELLFDYGPKFPNEQLGGKAKPASIPRVRNFAKDEFYAVEHDVDASGTRRARKAVTAKGRPRKVDDGAAPKQRGGARPGAGRKSHKGAPKAGADVDDGLGPDSSAEARLTAFNISDDLPDDATEVDAGAEDDDYLEPGDSGDDANEASEDEEGQDEKEVTGRFRSVRRRLVAGRRPPL